MYNQNLFPVYLYCPLWSPCPPKTSKTPPFLFCSFLFFLFLFPKVSRVNICWVIANHTFSSHLNPRHILNIGFVSVSQGRMSHPGTWLWLVSLHLSWLHRTPISYPIFIPFVLRLPCHTCAPIFLAHFTCFLEIRRSWEPGTRISTGILSPFCLFPKVSRVNILWVIANHTFSSHLNPQTDTFLCIMVNF
jgi:hypothetical protein